MSSHIKGVNALYRTSRFCVLQQNNLLRNFSVPNRGAKFAKKNIRKPKHLGRAPSKEESYFKKSHPTDADLAKNLDLYKNYNYILKSLVCMFQEELVQKQSMEIHKKDSSEEFVWNEEEHQRKCMEYNNIENARLLESRMKEIETQHEQEQIISAEKAEKLEEERLQRQQAIDAIFSQLEEESLNWITLENMEEKINEALDNPVNFNFAVFPNGIIARRTAQTL